MDICFAVYWNRVHDDMFETFLKTFRKHSDARLHICVDEQFVDNDFYLHYQNVEWVTVPQCRVTNRRALCKIELLQALSSLLADGDRLLVSDVDVYFLDDPFAAFNGFDLGVTTRGYECWTPVNGGIFYLKNSEQMRNFLSFYVKEIQNPCWDKYKELAEKLKRKTKDWYIGQDFLSAVYTNQEEIGQRFGIEIKDLGCAYNYCPDTYLMGFTEARDRLHEAYNSADIKTLHLKSQLKTCLYDGWLPDAVTKRLCDNWNWYEAGRNPN